MMHLQSALLCIAVHSKHFTIMWGVSPQPSPVCSIHVDDVTAATGTEYNGASALTTHQLQVERRERHRANQDQLSGAPT